MAAEKPLLEKFVLDVAHLSRSTNGRDAPIWWGIIGLILIELSVVTAFSTTVLYLQMVNQEWPPAGTQVPSSVIPTISLIILLVSCVTMRLAGVAINNNRNRRFVVYTAISVLLACVVLVIRWINFYQFDIRWDQNAYGSLLWTLTGFHFLHVVSAAIGTAVIAYAGVVGFFNKERQIGVVVDTLYWNFVVFAWVPFYFVLYWAPRLF